MPDSDTVCTLQRRVSCPLLKAPGPDRDQLDAIQRAALRAPDHMALRPWRFLVIEGGGRDRLGQIFVRAREQVGAVSDSERARLLAMPLRAPMIIVAVARISEQPKVPAIEQYLSTGAAVQNIITAAFALGFGAIWRTGDLAYNPDVRTGLGLASNEAIVGFVYLGTPGMAFRDPPALAPADYFQNWV